MVLKPKSKKGFEGGEHENLPVVRFTWSKLLARAFKIDVESCPACSGRLRMMGAITNPFQIRRYLQHVGEATAPPPISPASPEPPELFDDSASPEDLPAYPDY